MRTIAVLTVSRSDYWILRPILQRVAADPDLELRLLVGGVHAEDRFGRSIDRILEDGFPIAGRVDSSTAGDDPASIAAAAAETLHRTAPFLSKDVDILLLLGDRYEMLAAATAAALASVPIAHVHGGERSEGAVDDAFRHALTKMSHLHFVAHEEAARRVLQLGEEPWRVFVSGAPALDALVDFSPIDRTELLARVGLEAPGPFLLATFHPATLEAGAAAEQARELLEAIDEVGLCAVITAPGRDAESLAVRSSIEAFAAARPGRIGFAADLGWPAYPSMMAHAAAMVGNSSSGILEAASFGLPVVDVGDRQRGRLAPPNVIHAACRRSEVSAAIRRALDPAFRDGLKGLVNPYGDGRAAERIVQGLKSAPSADTLLRKRFRDLEG